MNGTEIARLTGGRYSTAAVLTAQLTGQSTSGNYSTFVLRGYMYYGGGTSTGSDYMSMYITGTEVKTGSYRLYPGYTYFGEKSVTVYHNNDGTFPGSSQGIGITCYHFPNGGEAWGDLSSLNVPTIPRQPSYTSKNATNITEHSVRLTGSVDTKGLGITDGGWDISTNGGSSWTYYAGGPTDKTITGLNSGTQYWYRGYVTTAGGGANSGWGSFTTKDCVVRKNINGTWKSCVPFLNVNGTWKKAIPYIKVNGIWKEGIN